MRRVLVTTMIILAVAAIARAQSEGSACDSCNDSYRAVTAPMGDHASAFADRDRRLGAHWFTEFRASLKLTNNSLKEIKRITWESRLIDQATGIPIRTDTLVTRKRIAPQQAITLKKTVVIAVRSPATNRTEQVVRIKAIEYADGSVETP